MSNEVEKFKQELMADATLRAEILADREAEGRAALLARVEEFIGAYVILPKAARLPVALWALATHMADLFDAFPYLCFSSPLPRCGKTRTIEILEFLVRRPWRGTTPSEAGLFRFLADCPTLLLDEIEGLSAKRKSERDQAILSILNSGYRKGATVLRWDAVTRTPEKLPVYGPKAFCLVGTLPPTLADRSIMVRMQRRRADETLQRFRFSRAKAEAESIRAEIESQSKVHSTEVSAVYAELPDLEFLGDRDAELFAPLFSVCSVFAPARLTELKGGAGTLCKAKAGEAEEDSLALRLLVDLHQLWPGGGEDWPTADALAALKAKTDSPWEADVSLTPRRIARMLRPFQVYPRDIRTNAGVRKGYVLSEVGAAYSRYITPVSATTATDRINSGQS